MGLTLRRTTVARRMASHLSDERRRLDGGLRRFLLVLLLVPVHGVDELRHP